MNAKTFFSGGAAGPVHRVAIVGASGYAGGEVLRLMLSHPAFEVATVCAHANAGERVAAVLPHLGVDPEMRFSPTNLDVLDGHDVVVLGLPHGQSGELARELRERNPSVVIADLGADFRLDDSAAWQEFYGSEHAGVWTYGLPELPLADGGAQRDLLKGTREIAVPGCNATALTFAGLPLVLGGLVDVASLRSVLSVGYSGAGKTPRSNLLFAEAAGGAAPYSAGGMHRHIPEVIQNFSRASGIAREAFRLTLAPVLVPMSRGILAVLTAQLGKGVGAADVGHAFTDAYASERLVRVLGEGGFPSTASVAGSSMVHLGWVVDGRSGSVSVMCAIDNLVKGTAGAAIQSLNIALGHDELLGVPIVGLHP